MSERILLSYTLVVKSFLWKIYLYKFFDSFKFIQMIFMLFFVDRGLTTWQISVLMGVWSFSQIILEVPLGVVADKYSRRNLLAMSAFLQSIGFALWLIPTMATYVGGFVLGGVKNALTSGTLEAFIYDELKAHQQQDQYEKVNGNLETIGWLGITTSVVIGGLVAMYSYDWVMMQTITACIAAGLAVLTIRSVKAVRSTHEAQYLMVLKRALGEVKNSPRIMYMLAFICLVFASYNSADEYWGLIYQSFGITVGSIGALLAVGYGCFALAGYTVRWFKRFDHRLHQVVLASAAAFLLAAYVQSPISLPLIFVGMYLLKVAQIKFDAKFQHAIQADQRATISSLKGLLFELIYIGFVMVYGFVSSHISMISIIYLMGLLLLGWTVLFRLVFPKLFGRMMQVSAVEIP